MLVRVYKNLHNGLISIQCRKSHLVIGHCEGITLEDVKFIVNESGRQRVLRERRKNIHAFVQGNIVAVNGLQSFRNRVLKANQQEIVLNDALKLRYNPYTTNEFLDSDGRGVTGARLCNVHITSGIKAIDILR